MSQKELLKPYLNNMGRSKTRHLLTDEKFLGYLEAQIPKSHPWKISINKSTFDEKILGKYSAKTLKNFHLEYIFLRILILLLININSLKRNVLNKCYLYQVVLWKWMRDKMGMPNKQDSIFIILQFMPHININPH